MADALATVEFVRSNVTVAYDPAPAIGLPLVICATSPPAPRVVLHAVLLGNAEVEAYRYADLKAAAEFRA